MSEDKIFSIIDSEIVELFEDHKDRLLCFFTALQMPNWPKWTFNKKIDVMYLLFEDFFESVDDRIVEECGVNIETKYLYGHWGEPTRYINSQHYYSVKEIGHWFLEVAFVSFGKVNRNVSILRKLHQSMAVHTAKLYSPALLVVGFIKLMESFYKNLYIDQLSLTEAKIKARESQRQVISLGISPYIDRMKKIFK